jgi:cell division protein FtsW
MIDEETEKRHGLDPLILTLVAGLAALGLLMVFSVSLSLKGGPVYYLRTQAEYMLGGVALMLAVSFGNLRRLNDWRVVYAMLGVVFVLLLLVFKAPFAAPANHAHRWLRLPLHMQPSEFAKGALLLFMAHHLAQAGDKIRSLVYGVLPMVGITGLFAAVIAKEPDLGAATTIAFLLLVMLFIGGARKRLLAAFFALSVPPVAYLIIATPWRLKRLLGFLNPAADTLGVNWQSWQAQIAIGRGGLTGVGFGNGWQKLNYVPEMHTDFILANLGEELGLVGLLAVFLLFFALVWRSIRLTMKAEEPFLRLCGVGASALLGVQIVVNAGVVMSLLPNKGLAMPFFSYGGSNTLLNFFLTGVILAVARTRREEDSVQRKVLHVLPRRTLADAAGEPTC